MAEHLVIGHGSGSFGHMAAAASGMSGTTLTDEPRGIAATQASAAALHSRVMGALLEAGLPAFSFPPSATTVAREAGIARYEAEPIAIALDLGLVPVVYGDVILAPRGARIASTETVFEELVETLPALGCCVGRILWAGDTEGVYDDERETISEIDPETCSTRVVPTDAIVGSDAVDVTGGMAHRVSVAVGLARAGVASWIGDGSRPGRIEKALRGQDRVPGTCIRGQR